MIRTIQQDKRTSVHYHDIGPHHFTYEKGALFLHYDSCTNSGYTHTISFVRIHLYRRARLWVSSLTGINP